MKASGVGAVLAASVITLAACGGSGNKPAGAQGMDMAGMAGMAAAPVQPGGTVATTTVAIKNFAFSPATITVKSGATVVWTNDDSVDHTVSFQNNGISSADLGTNDTFSHTFTTPGTYNYLCTIHPFMHGTVIVTG